MTFRFALISAVSSEEQATSDRDSLDHQLRTAREFGERMGGTFVREYRIDGFTRSGYYDLTAAFRDVPELDRLARGVMAHEFNVIILESYDRLGDLGFMLWNFLKPYRVQLRSVQQLPIIEPPETYNPAKDDATPTMINNALNTNVYRINKINRAFAVGNAKRAREGLFAINVPFGYVKLDKRNITPNPQVAEYIKQWPEWYLSGMSLSDIARRANDEGFKTPRGKRWTYAQIHYMLTNPFYAGLTYYGKGHKDKLRNSWRPNKHYETYQGKHEPLWSYDTHLAILAEHKRRNELRQTRRDYNLTGLLICAECGEKLKASYSSVTGKPNDNRYWRCDNRHVSIRMDTVNELVAAELVRLFASDASVPAKDKPKRKTDAQLVQVRRQLVRLDEAYEAGAYTVTEYSGKRKELRAREAELLDVEKQAAQAQREAGEQARTIKTMRELSAHFSDWIKEADPREVKHHLSRVVRITVYPSKVIKAELI